MGLYTACALAAVGLVVGLELLVWRTGLFRRRTYWVTMAIVVFFQVLVDGWLTHRIVVYNPTQFSGVRFPLRIPIEDFAYGFALVTWTLARWVRAGEGRSGWRPGRPAAPAQGPGSPA
jgi:lycopene cyclase domain-containing protein